MRALQLLTVTLIFSLVVVIGSAVLHAPAYLSFAAAGIALSSTLVLLYGTMRYVGKLVDDSNALLNKHQRVSPWSLTNLVLLKQNQEATRQKITTSAELIENLTHPERNASTVPDANDPIGKALLTIRGEMHKIKEEDSRRQWITQGLANFGEVLRNKVAVAEYSQRIISSLVRYIEANQGKLYIAYTNADGQRYLELTASYAYGKAKHGTETIYEGQGMLGQNMLEKDFVFITDVPQSYVKITSGLGEATPRNIIIAPLIFNEMYWGAIELASFTVMEAHHIEFLKRVSENIASEVSSLKTIDRTQSLLEESRNLTRELQSREEDMKRHFEELAATQDEMARKQSELAGIINAIDSTLATAEFDAHGKLIRHNAILEQFTGLAPADLARENYTLLTGRRDDALWQKLWTGQMRAGDFKTLRVDGEALWLSITFTPIANFGEGTGKLLCMIQNITQKKLREMEFERLSIVANNTDNSVIITNKLGYIEYVNAGFTRMTGFSADEVTAKKPGALLQGPLTDARTIAKLSHHIASGIPIYEEILNYTKQGESYWVSLAINPVRNEAGEIVQFISIQADITQTKIKALDFNQKLEALSRSNAILEIDRNGIVLDINDNYLQILGYTRGEVVGKAYNLLTHKENVFTKLLDTLRTQRVQSGVYSRYHKNGNRHCMKLMDYPVYNMKGDLEKIIEFGVDVSNEKRLEKEAERRQAELKSYLEGINNTIASAAFSLSGNILEANDIFLKVMGYTRDELSTAPFTSLMGGDAAVHMMWDNLRLGKFFSGEFKMRNKAGKELWLTGTFNPMTVEGNEPEKVLMFAQFTTQEKEKINDLNGMVSALKATLPVLEFTPQFGCKTANEKAMKLFGLSRMSLRSRTMEDFIVPDYHQLWRQIKDEIVRSEAATFIVPFIAGEGTVNYEVSTSLVRNLEGDIAKILVLLVREVSEKVNVLRAV